MRVAYPTTKDGKRVHAVRGSVFEADFGDDDKVSLYGESLCDRRVLVLEDAQFLPSADGVCTRCATVARASNGHMA